MKIGILGTGRVASALGKGFAAAGHDVLLGSRDPSRRHPDLPTAGLRNAAEHGAVLVNAVSGRASLEALAAAGEETLADKPMIDPALAVTPELELIYPNSSLAEEIQTEFPRTRVVKTLCGIRAELMADPGALSEPGLVFLSGNDPEAKGTVDGLLADLGWPAESRLDLGDVTTARGQEHLVPLLLAVFGALGTSLVNIDFVRARSVL